MAKKKRELPLNVGTSSVLFIFVILCLVSFAILSLSSAMSDYKLSKRVVENSQAYYDACNEAEEQLASFDKTLKDLYDTGISRAGYFENVGKKRPSQYRLTIFRPWRLRYGFFIPRMQASRSMILLRGRPILPESLTTTIRCRYSVSKLK